MSVDVDLFSKKFDLIREIAKLLTAPETCLSIDACGHDVGNLQKIDRVVEAYVQTDDVASLETLRDALSQRKPLAKPLVIDSLGRVTCAWCGDRPGWEYDGTTLRSLSVCQYPNGIDHIVELNVPSGVIVIGNDFRPTFDTDVELDNDHYSAVQYSKGFERDKCACLYVSNSCPSVRETGRNQFAIVSGESWTGKDLGHIVTDLWWYMAVDLDEAERRKLPGIKKAIKLKVRRGVYRFSHEMHKKGFNSDAENVLYTTIKRVGPPQKD